MPLFYSKINKKSNDFFNAKKFNSSKKELTHKYKSSDNFSLEHSHFFGGDALDASLKLVYVSCLAHMWKHTPWPASLTYLMILPSRVCDVGTSFFSLCCLLEALLCVRAIFKLQLTKTWMKRFFLCPFQLVKEGSRLAPWPFALFFGLICLAFSLPRSHLFIFSDTVALFYACTAFGKPSRHSVLPRFRLRNKYPRPTLRRLLGLPYPSST